jgi:hypothetical protein
MAPIHESDIAEKRWNEAEWKHYELWEKVELRLRRRKRIWIGSTIALFLILSAVPILIDRIPKWAALTAINRLAREINHIKTEATIAKKAYRVRFVGGGSLSYVVEASESCAGTGGWTAIREKSLLGKDTAEKYAIVDSERGRTLNLPGLVDSFCYDYLSGGAHVLEGSSVVGFGIMPVKDLTEGRSDRLSLLLLSGPSAEIFFD